MKTAVRLHNANLNILIVMLVFVLAMAGCVKDQENSTILEKPDNSLHPFLFNKGSYWIYTMVPLKADTIKTVPKDSLTAPKDSIIYVRDSINIVSDSTDVESIEKDTLYITGNVRYYEYYRIKYHSLVKDTIKDHSSAKDTLYEEQLMGYVISRGLNNGGFMLLSSKKKGEKNMNAEIIDVMEEMKLGNRTYKQVVKMKVSKDQYISDSYFLYYVDNVGIIRKEKLVNDTIRETWNLNRYKVSLLKLE